MTRRSLRLLAAMVWATSACSHARVASSSDDEPPLLDTWTREANAETPCDRPSVASDAGWIDVILRNPEGSVRLPLSFREIEAAGPQARRWIAADSTELTMWSAKEPMNAMASNGGMMARLQHPSYHLEERCRIDAGGHLATMMEFRHVDYRGTDTVFGIVADVLIRPGTAFGAMGLTHSQAMRDSLFTSFSQLRIGAVSH